MLIALLYSGLAAASATQVPEAAPAKPIVVIGRRIRDARAALDSCLARKCPPDEEIAASLALAETQIIAGQYTGARATLLRALDRNKDEARRYPIPLSDLYRANGRVAAHLGYDEDYYRSTWGIYRTLKKGLPSAQTRHFNAKFEIAHMMGRTRGHERARLHYDNIAREARGAGRPDIAAIAELRSLLDHHPDGAARTEGVQRIAESRDPALRGAALEANLALARMAYERGDLAAAGEVQRKLADLDLKEPLLIYSPPYDALEQEIAAGGDFAPPPMGGPPGPKSVRGFTRGGWSATKRMASNFDDMWVDVGFRVMPDGTVADLEIVRSKGDKFWTRPLLASIRHRRYMPGKPDDPASYIVERYTYTAGYEDKTGTRLAGRSPEARMEYIDLSDGGLARPE